MNETRPTAVAGTFYPADRHQLSASLEQLFTAATGGSRVPRAIVAPHAGYQYSGALAAQCYAPLCAAKEQINRVLLLGPSHRVAFKGIAASTHTKYATPLGDIAIDAAATKRLLDQSLVGFLDEAHAEEHSLEVHLPFLQHALGEFSLIPLVVGDAPADHVAKIIESFWSDEHTLVVVSTDLSHFHPEAKAAKIDRCTADKILQLTSTLVGEEACGCRPVNGLLQFAKQHNLTIHEVGITTSAASSGDRQRVVGYGGFHLFAKTHAKLTRTEQQQALSIARSAIEFGLRKTSFNLESNFYTQRFSNPGASFVSLHINDQLRGCIGSLTAHRNLHLDIAHNAQAAAFKDPRFAPISVREYANTDIELSILSEPESLGVLDFEQCLNILRPGVDGIILKQDQKQSTYLPSVWAQISDPTEFLHSLRQKAGLDPNKWHNCEVWRYQTDTFQ